MQNDFSFFFVDFSIFRGILVNVTQVARVPRHAESEIEL